MAKMFIPDIGFKFTLSRDWSFRLYKEYRNTTLWEAYFDKDTLTEKFEEFAVIEEAHEKAHQEKIDAFHAKSETITDDDELMVHYRAFELDYGFAETFFDVTLQKGTELAVDRVYIRKGQTEYSSITFNVVKAVGLNKKGRLRFWVKLDDANNIEFD